MSRRARIVVVATDVACPRCGAAGGSRCIRRHNPHASHAEREVAANAERARRRAALLQGDVSPGSAQR
jgi:hypothetical protein